MTGETETLSSFMDAVGQTTGKAREDIERKFDVREHIHQTHVSICKRRTVV